MLLCVYAFLFVYLPLYVVVRRVVSRSSGEWYVAYVRAYVVRIRSSSSLRLRLK